MLTPIIAINLLEILKDFLRGFGYGILIQRTMCVLNVLF
jgi:hypothetical protein